MTAPHRPLPWAAGRRVPDSDLPRDNTSVTDDPVCRAKDANGYLCSMRPGHGGDFHRAGTGDVIVAEWATS